MQKVIYLAGFISTLAEESLLWRARVTPRLEEMGFEVRDPLRGKAQIKTESPDGGITIDTYTSTSIVLRDFKDVRESDYILMHLETWGAERPLLGTIAEAAWAWERHIPIIGIAFPKNSFMRNHPFMVEFISHLETSEERALVFINRYYAPKSLPCLM